MPSDDEQHIVIRLVRALLRERGAVVMHHEGWRVVRLNIGTAAPRCPV